MDNSDTNSDQLFDNSDFFLIQNLLGLKPSEMNEEDLKYKTESNTNNLLIGNLGLEMPFSECKPDADSIKMFVGQIPQSFTKCDLLQMFEKFGKVYDLRVLKDKTTGRSKGCCFVTFFTRRAALAAQDALHNIKVMPGMHHPIQMKPADTDNRNDRKLFIGMLSKKYTESDVRNLFSPYGTIEECTVLRDGNGRSKGCAFVTYLSRQSAQNAVKSMHHCHIFEGCSSPVVVKFADTQKEKELRRLRILLKEINDQSHISAVLQQLQPADSLTPMIIYKKVLQQIQTNEAVNVYSQFPILNSLNIPNAQTSDLGSITSCPLNLQRLTNTYLSNQFTNQNLGSITLNEAIAWNNIMSGAASLGLLPQGYLENSHIYPSTDFDQIGRCSSDKLMLNQKHIEGPDGANLFIYHLPYEFTDQKLAELFNIYGRVISAKVFIDKVTKQSKGFGFVSYNKVLDANVAIKYLNGYQILGKKLKVEVKKKKVTC